MSAKPIIFSAAMIKALLAGRKSMTRRILKPQPTIEYDLASETQEDLELRDMIFDDERGDSLVAERRGHIVLKRPIPYRVGDLLWVKETFTSYNEESRAVPVIKALYGVDFEGFNKPERDWNWTSSRFMPLWASRITLKVTAVKVERLQEISEADAKAEGAACRHYVTDRGQRCFGWSMDWPLDDKDCENHSLGGARYAFGNFLCRLHNGPHWNLKPNNIWDANPFVVVPTFEVIKKNVADVLLEMKEVA